MEGLIRDYLELIRSEHEDRALSAILLSLRTVQSYRLANTPRPSETINKA